MELPDPDDLAAAARRIVDASPALETEVTAHATRDAFVRFARRGPTQSADRVRVDLAIRVRLGPEGDAGYREARATTGSLDEVDTRAALERALALARVSPTNGDLLPMGGPVEVRPTALDEATLGHGFEQKARWVGRALAACEGAGLAPAGLVQTTGQVRCLVNSAGRDVGGRRSRAAFALTASGRDGAGSGWGEGIASRVEALDVEGVVRRAVDKAASNARPAPIEPGEYTVVLEPAAVSSILLFAGYYGFGAREVDERSSFLCGRIGEPVFSPEVTILDDAGNDVYPGLPFDGEGTPRERVTLVDRGRPTGPVTDPFYAKKLGLPCTGHAPPRPSSEGPAAENLVVAPGAASPADLLEGIDRGLLVTQFHYTNMIEPRELTLTGMTRNGTFLVEGGEVVGAVRNLRFTETLVNALARVTRVGREPEVVGALFDGEVVTPALRIDGFRFTSTTDF